MTVFQCTQKELLKILDALHKCYGEEMKYFIEARISNILSGEFLEGILEKSYFSDANRCRMWV